MEEGHCFHYHTIIMEAIIMQALTTKLAQNHPALMHGHTDNI